MQNKHIGLLYVIWTQRGLGSGKIISWLINKVGEVGLRHLGVVKDLKLQLLKLLVFLLDYKMCWNVWTKWSHYSSIPRSFSKIVDFNISK
jgi:hypothetical protein